VYSFMSNTKVRGAGRAEDRKRRSFWQAAPDNSVCVRCQVASFGWGYSNRRLRVRSSEMLAYTCQTTRCHDAEDYSGNLHHISKTSDGIPHLCLPLHKMGDHVAHPDETNRYILVLCIVIRTTFQTTSENILLPYFERGWRRRSMLSVSLTEGTDTQRLFYLLCKLRGPLGT
jgi:hypothetical protein